VAGTLFTQVTRKEAAVSSKRKGATQWETKAGKRASTRVRNRRQANRIKRRNRSRISNRKALRERNQDSSATTPIPRELRRLFTELQNDRETSLPSGAYSSRLEASDFVPTRKMMLLR